MRPPFPLITPRQSFGFGAVVLCAGFTAQVQASGFFEDTTAKIESRTVYFNRDFHNEPSTTQSKREEWAQGFMLNLESGYTEGTVGFGVDALGMLGVKLDSGRGRSGTGLLPVHADGRAADEFASLGMTAKARLAKTTLKYGTLLPKTPVLIYNDARGVCRPIVEKRSPS